MASAAMKKASTQRMRRRRERAESVTRAGYTGSVLFQEPRAPQSVRVRVRGTDCCATGCGVGAPGGKGSREEEISTRAPTPTVL